MNVYQMIEAGYFDAPGGFWLKRNSWSDLVANVTQYEPLLGLSPYFNNPAVYVDLYWSRGVLKQRNALLSCPGTYAYTRVDAPRLVVSE